MAIEYTFYSAADMSTETLRSRIAAALAGSITPDGTVTREGLTATAYRVAPGEEATAPSLFGFMHRVSVRFRFSATRRDLEGHNTALMVGAVLGLADSDGVLLFNGEENVLQSSAGEITFAAGWDGWDDMPEVTALQDEHRTGHLNQPLL
ncbi:SitI3 family protein [Paractinoplanes toevensis]|uniref:Uncharacterized protein n=1 Tax=Paractinoplanes toevensis TaxID=571911 RepID=A0A919W2Q5_9ACTN|nr:SitI3 family protein [Actinoplanes toevensis]GIM89750.1 hypothetical protein Ato02nite_015430 [Actinoplanes toevensis]